MLKNQKLCIIYRVYYIAELLEAIAFDFQSQVFEKENFHKIFYQLSEFIVRQINFNGTFSFKKSE